MDRPLIRTKSGLYTLYSPHGSVDVPSFLQAVKEGEVTPGKGRRGIILFRFQGRRLALRWYTHGGLLRAFTGELFWGTGRMVRELTVTLYLRDRGFRVVEPFCGLSAGKGPFKKLAIVTVLEEGATEFLDTLRGARGKERAGLSGDLAAAMAELVRLGVYHPDLHLKNVLVRRDRSLVFLDFDRARRKTVTRRDVERMLWRLYRYVDKMARRYHNTGTVRDVLVFLSVYRKHSGMDVLPSMRRKAGLKRPLHRLGWFLESLFYGGGK